jgi:predicted nucleotidyltransferase
VVTDERATEYLEVKRSVVLWARQRADIVGVALVGSWARRQARMDSDIDFVLLTPSKDHYVVEDEWATEAVSPSAGIIRTEEWGPLTERRVRLPSGLDVEFGFAPPSWAATAPVDPGTARVVRHGCLPLLDPAGLLARLMAAV